MSFFKDKVINSMPIEIAVTYLYSDSFRIWSQMKHILSSVWFRHTFHPVFESHSGQRAIFVEIMSNVSTFNRVFVFAKMEPEGLFDLAKWKVPRVNRGSYFAQFVQLLISNIIREISCEVIYSLSFLNKSFKHTLNLKYASGRWIARPTLSFWSRTKINQVINLGLCFA